MLENVLENRTRGWKWQDVTIGDIVSDEEPDTVEENTIVDGITDDQLEHQEDMFVDMVLTQV